MKVLVFFLALGFATFCLSDTPLYGYFWLRYTYNNPTTPEVEVHNNSFSIDRGYIRWRTKTRPVAFNATMDITNKKDATNASDWHVRLKYAHADWQLPTIGQYFPDIMLMIGLQKVYFGVVDIWDYPLIEKNLEERENIMSSADLGLGIHGSILDDHGEFSAQIFNGNFYSHVTENNLNKAICGNVALTPIPGITFKGSIWLANQPSGDTLSTQVDQNRYAGVFRVIHGPVTVFAEYLATKSDNLKGGGYSVFTEYAVTNRFSLLGRYDYFDIDTATDNNAVNVAILGFNCRISETLLFQANYERIMPEDNTTADTDVILCQFKVSY